MRIFFSHRFLIVPLLAALCAGIIFPVFSSAQVDKESLQQQLDAVQKEIEGLDIQIEGTKKEKETLAREVELIDSDIKKRQLEIKRLDLVIKQTTTDISVKNNNITDLSRKIERSRGDLQTNLLALYRYDDASMIEALLTYSSLSQFFDSLNNLENIQEGIQDNLGDLRVNREAAETARDDLQEFKEEQGALRSLREVERRVIERNKSEKNELLRLTKGKEALFQQILSQK
jgi:septal ring factor EnvC (AmiA/AmiB activator)